MYACGRPSEPAQTTGKESSQMTDSETSNNRDEVTPMAKPPTEPVSKSLHHRAASWSIGLPASFLALMYLCGVFVSESNARDVAHAFAQIDQYIFVTSVVLGFFGLAGIPKHGVRSILIPSLFGIVVSGTFLIMIFGVFSDRVF